MDIISLQNSLKGLYYSLGGSADNVRDTQDLNTIIDEMSKLDISSGSGGSGGTLYVGYTNEEEYGKTVLDTTWQEMWDAWQSGACIIVKGKDTYAFANDGEGWTFDLCKSISKYPNANAYSVEFDKTYLASSADGYPTYTEDPQ